MKTNATRFCISICMSLTIGQPAFAGLQEGIDAFSAGNYGRAFAEFDPLADSGDPEAQVYLCMMYHEGLGNIRKDLTISFSYCLQAAEKNHLFGQYLTGLAYLNGDGIPQDFKEAIKWLEASTESELGLAEYELSQLYLTGRGVDEDRSKWLSWLKRSAAKGHEPAKFQLRTMFPDQDALRELSLPQIRINAEAGFSGAQQLLGHFYKTGTPNLRKDSSEALKWYTRAARQGDELAQYFLGEMYWENHDISRNVIEAHMWLNIAASQGSESASDLRDEVEQSMSADEIAIAQERASAFRPIKEQQEAFP